MSHRWRAVVNTVSGLTGPRFEPQTSLSREELVTAQPTGRFSNEFETQNATNLIFKKFAA